MFLCAVLSFFSPVALGSYHQSVVFLEGGLRLCWLGAEGRITAASHQQGCVYNKHTEDSIQSATDLMRRYLNINCKLMSVH